MATSTITPTSTLKELIDLGIIKPAQIDTWNRRLTRGAEKRADVTLQNRCDQAVAYFIGMTYKQGFDNRFRKKPMEKALLSSGISRSMMDKSIKNLVEVGALANNSEDVSNQCHTRHWIPEAE
jgi:hypothetical protein